jgi:hypothetical protein
MGSQPIHRPWREWVEPNDEEGDQFVNCFPLLQETIGESWTLSDLSSLDLNGLSSSEEHYWLSQSSSPEFVTVGFRSGFFLQRGVLKTSLIAPMWYITLNYHRDLPRLCAFCLFAWFKPIRNGTSSRLDCYPNRSVFVSIHDPELTRCEYEQCR